VQLELKPVGLRARLNRSDVSQVLHYHPITNLHLPLNFYLFPSYQLESMNDLFKADSILQLSV
jgi:hypothetical protein